MKRNHRYMYVWDAETPHGFKFRMYGNDKNHWSPRHVSGPRINLKKR